jgi:transposase
MHFNFKSQPPNIKNTALVSAAHSSAIGIDVHANMLVASFQRCELGTRNLEVKETRVEPTTPKALAAFASVCREFDPEVIIMESTGACWLSLYSKLEEAGFDGSRIHVVNARDVKAVRGKKTDEADAKRLGEVARMGTSRPSFILPKEFRELRLLSRTMRRIKGDGKSALQRVHRDLSSLGCRASAVFSDIRGLAASKIIKAVVERGLQGQELFDFVCANCGKLRHKPEEICDALEADMRSTVWESIRSSMRMVNCAESERAGIYSKIMQLPGPYSHWLKLLQTIPGIKEAAAVQILCEIGPDPSSFGSSARSPSWAGLSPGNNESAGRRTSGRTPRGNRCLRTTLVECASAISLMKEKGGKLGQCFQTMKERRGHLRAVIATAARKLLRIICAMFRDDDPYHEDPECQTLRQRRVERFRAAAKGVAEANLVIEGDMEIKEGSGRTCSTVRIEPRRKGKSAN